MNANLMTIDCLPLAKAQPTGRNSSPKLTFLGQNKSELGEISSKTVEKSTVNEQKSEQLRGDENNRRPEATGSDNAGAEKSGKTRTVKDAGFKKILKRQLVNDESQDEQNTGQISAAPQTTGAEVNSAQQIQINSLPEVQMTDAIPDQPPVTAEPQIIPQTNNITPVILMPNSSESASAAQSAVVSKNGEGQNLQIQITVPDKLQIEINKGQPNQLTITRIATDNPQQGQSQAPQVLNILANNGQNIADTIQQNVDNNTDKADLPVNPKADSGKPETVVNQNNPNTGSTTPNVSTNQPALAQSKVQLADLPAATTPVNSFADGVGNQAQAKGEQSGTETPARHNTDNKSADVWVNTPQSAPQNSAFTTNVEGLTAGFDKVQIETVSGKNNETQQQANSLISQPVTAQSAVSPFGQIIGGRPVAADRGASHVNNASAQDTASSIREQISLSLQNSIQQGERQITIHLNPPELGRVSIKFTERAGELSGMIETTNSQTRAEIQQSIPEILRSLEQSGVSIKRIDVSMSDLSRQPAQDFSRNNTAQSQWEQFAQHGFNDGDNRFSQDSFVNSSRFGGISGFPSATEMDTNSNSSSNNLLNVLI